MDFINNLKLKTVSQYCQLILLDKKGLIVESCDSLFTTTTLRQHSISHWIPMLEGTIDALSNLETKVPINLQKIPAPSSFLTGIYDLEVAPYSERDAEEYLLTIFDFTDKYQELLKFQQERNECLIKTEHLEAELKKYKSSPK